MPLLLWKTTLLRESNNMLNLIITTNTDGTVRVWNQSRYNEFVMLFESSDMAWQFIMTMARGD